MKTELTIEESAKLVELGVDPKMASKCNSTMKVCSSGRGIIRVPETMPIFTLSDLLSILPNSVSPKADVYTLQMVYDNYRHKWVVEYRTMGLGIRKHSEAEKELIDSLYQLLIWAIEHNYVNIKNEKK